MRTKFVFSFLLAIIQFSQIVAQQITWERRYLDLPAPTGGGESLFEVGEVPQGYLGIGATRDAQGIQLMTITQLNLQGDNLKTYSVPRVQGFDFFLNPEDTSVIYHGWETVGGISFPCIAKIDLAGNTKWIERYDYPGCRAFFKAVRLPNKEFLLTDNAWQNIPLIHLDSMGKMISVKYIGNFFNTFEYGDIQMWTDSTVLVVSDGEFGLPDSLLTINDCGHDPWPESDGTYFAELDFKGNLVREWSRFNYAKNHILGDMKFAILPNKRIVRHILEYRTAEQPCQAVDKVVCYDQWANKLWTTEVSININRPRGCWTDARQDVLFLAENNTSPIYTYPNGTQIDDGRGQFWKLDGETGQIIWHKAFMGPGVDQKDRAFLNDLQPTSDGGLLLGLSFVATPTSTGTEKWFVKLDSAGCLIPGCDSFWLAPTPSSVLQLEEPISFSFYPNPATDHINYMLDPSIQDGWFVFTNVSGNTRQRYAPFTSFMGTMSVEGLESGMHTVAVYDSQKRLRAVEKLVVQR